VVGASLIGQALGVSSIVFYCFSIFVLPLELAFGWSRTGISFALTLASLSTVAASLIVGILVDRVSIRTLLIPSIAAIVVLLWLLAMQPGNIWFYYSIYVALPLLCAGTQPVVYSRAIITWFDQNRGLALGIALSGSGIGAVFLPTILTGIVEEIGWRRAYVFLSFAVLSLSLPTAALFVRENQPGPKQVEPDINRPVPTNTSFKSLILHSKIHVDPVFLKMLGSFLLVGFALTGIVGHLIPILTWTGLTAQNAALVTAIFGASVVFGRVAAGALMDRYHAPRIAFAFLLGPAIGCLFFAWPNGHIFALIVATALLGLAMGAEFDILGLFVSRYFDHAHFGKIYGLLYASFLLGGASGPLFMGHIYDATESYQLALLSMSGVLAVGASFMLLLKPFPKS